MLRVTSCFCFFLCSLTPINVFSQEASHSIAVEGPMAKDSHPDFLVATIKPSDPNERNGGCPINVRQVSCHNYSVIDILSLAYNIHAKQIVDGPEWLSKERFDINGVPDQPGIASLVQIREMFQKLLANRFQLKCHKGSREIPVYALRVGAGGPKLTPADPAGRPNSGHAGTASQPILKFRNMSMADFVLNMNRFEDRPVVDETGLPGKYDFTLTWTADDTVPQDSETAPSLFTAIKEQLGLKIDLVKGPAEALIIDSVERPSAN